MTTRSKIDLRFPCWRQTAGNPPARSVWIDEALDGENADPAASLAGVVVADVCIVGGGYTGLWTAYRLLELQPMLRLCVVEADLCGTGASGRNSGAAGHWWGKLPDLVRFYGPKDAVKVLRASENALVDIHTFVANENVKCELRLVPSVWSANTPVSRGPWEAVFEVAERLGLEAPYRRLSAEELRHMFGAAPFTAGVLQNGATRLQPAMLARALRRHVIHLGGSAYELSPVSSIEGAQSYVRVRTKQGEVRARHVVLAASAWMAHLDEFRAHTHATSSDIVVTHPIPDVLAELGLTKRPGVLNSRQMVNYGGITPDGRVYLGRGGGALSYRSRITPDFHWSAKRAREVEADFRFLYPELGSVPIARSWAGPIDRSTTGLPRFGRLQADERISYAVGYSGHGVGASALGGRILASLALRRDDDWSRLGALLSKADNGRFPPEPARYFFGSLVRSAVARKERAEQLARRISWVDRKLAGLANFTLKSRWR